MADIRIPAGVAAPRRGRPRSEQADRSILQAAAELLAERGLGGMSIEEVAARAGVGKTTIYRRWTSRGTLALDAFLTEFQGQQPLPDTGSLRGDLLAALLAACDGELGHFRLMQNDAVCVSVVLAARGYPGSYARGGTIGGLDRAAEIPHVAVFHAGTDLRNGTVVANGGRVLTVCGTGPTIEAARFAAYTGVGAITWEDKMFRNDIGLRALAREQNS